MPALFEKIIVLLRSIFFFLTLISSISKAQQSYTSIVVDSASFVPMPYVSVYVKHGQVGTLTNEKGSFTLQASKKDTLVISFIGYNSIEYALYDWEPGLIRLSEKKTVLNTITIHSTAINPYQGMFDDDNERIAGRHNNFYYSKAKKEKRKLAWLKEDNIQTKTYVEVVINSSDLKNELMKKYALTETQYYQVLAEFNKNNSEVMYYLTYGELVTLIKNFYALATRNRK